MGRSTPLIEPTREPPAWNPAGKVLRRHCRQTDDTEKAASRGWNTSAPSAARQGPAAFFANFEDLGSYTSRNSSLPSAQRHRSGTSSRSNSCTAACSVTGASHQVSTGYLAAGASPHTVVQEWNSGSLYRNDWQDKCHMRVCITATGCVCDTRRREGDLA